MNTSRIERDTEFLIDTQLKNLGWNSDPYSSSRNVYMQRVRTEQQRAKLQGKRPDYTLYPTQSNDPIAIIEAKKPGRNIHQALAQGGQYAQRLDVPLVFATDGVFTKTLHTKSNRPLKLNGEEIDELIREVLALRYLTTDEVVTLDKKVAKSRGELIAIFDTVNDLLREEGLQQGLERFTEFANILFLKVLSEIEDAKEDRGEESSINRAYRWDYFREKKGTELLSYVSDTVLKWFSAEYKDDHIFQPLQIKHPANLKQMIELLKSTVYGADLTKTASIAKMNMILAGDGHSNIVRHDSLAHPIDNQYDIVLTNMPFAQKTRHGDTYTIPNRSGDIVCPQHCYRALRPGGRMALIVPEGFLSNTNSKAYQDVRKYLLDNATLKSVVSLPRGAFEPYNRAKADILYFTDVKKSKTKGHYWFFDVKNDGYTLDKRRRRVEGGNDLELVLSENDLENQASDYLSSIGITGIDVAEVESNNYILNAAHYRDLLDHSDLKYPTVTFGDLFELSGADKIGDDENAPVMSITMAHGLIDQGEKFNKRIASRDISKYKKVYKNELVVGFPIDEGVLGFQLKYPYAAVSPAYKIWKLKRDDINIRFLDMLLRSPQMRAVYQAKLQGAVDRRRSISKDVFLRIRIPIPPTEVQAGIVKKQGEIEDAAGAIKKIEQEINTELTDLWEQPETGPLPTRLFGQ